MIYVRIRNLLLNLGIALSLCLVSGAGFSASLVAKRSKVKVKSKPKGGDVIKVLKKGDQVESLGRKGMYWKVKVGGGKIGYVSVTKVKRQAGTSKGLAKAIRAAAKDGRDKSDEVVSARSRSAVMGVRGLDESEDTAFAGNVKPNLRMVYKMEDRPANLKKIDSLGNMVMNEVESLVDEP